MEPVQPVQMNIYQSDTYRKDLSWLNFGDAPRVQERHQGSSSARKEAVDIDILVTSRNGDSKIMPSIRVAIYSI